MSANDPLADVSFRCDQAAMTLTFKLGTMVLLGTLAMPLPAAELPPTALHSIGFEEVRLGELEGTPHFNVRATTPHGFISVTADFNGNGTPNEARILRHNDRQIAYVVAVISSPEHIDTYVLASFPLSDVPFIAIDAVEPQADLMDGSIRNGVGIFDLRTGKGKAQFFDGEGFSVAFPLNRTEVAGRE